MQNIDIEVVESRLLIDFSGLGISSEMLETRTREVLPLLCALLSADAAWFRLSDSEARIRKNAYAAIDVMCKLVMKNALDRAELLQAIVEGRASIADHGFPEFDNGQSLDV